MSESQARCCPTCGGTQRPGRTTFTVDFGTLFFAVRDVPAMICDQCGAEWFSASTVHELNRLAEEAKAKDSQVEILSAGRLALQP